MSNSTAKMQPYSASGQNGSLAYGKEVIKAEAEALLSLLDNLDEHFSSAVDSFLALETQGRVIVSGMGKAGFVGMKISATLASTGTPSFFLHPAEALHGDLGRYTKHDIALILSNSGETPEVLANLAPIKAIGCPVVCMTANPNSSLAKHSDIVLNLGKFKEAGHLGLAPTTSTTVMLALGDALAMAVLKQRGFSSEQFAFFHPGGNLGRALMTVDEIMRKGESLPLVSENLTVKETLRKIIATAGRPGAAIVVNEAGILSGVLTDGDLRRCLERDDSFLDKNITSVMTKNPKNIQSGKLVQEALNVMSSYKIDELIVVDNSNRPIGYIDIQDLVNPNFSTTFKA